QRKHSQRYGFSRRTKSAFSNRHHIVTRNPAMRKILSRRTLLRGAGGAFVALPFLEEMQPRIVRAQEAQVPMRLITMFFGLGVARDESTQQFSGPLEPYQPLADKMAFFTNLEAN